MKYEYYLYKANANSEDAFILQYINEAVKNRFWSKDYDMDKAEDAMESLDSAAVIKALKELIPEYMSCVFYTNYSPALKKEYVCVACPIEHASKLMKHAKYVAEINDLILYDPISDRSFFHTDYVVEQYAATRIRRKVLIPLLNNSRKFFMVTKIGEELEKGRTILSYAITLKKTDNSFKQQVADFDALLRGLLLDDEVLSYEDGCFNLTGKYVTMRFVVEGYKHACLTGCIENGEVYVRDIHRMGCYDATILIRKNWNDSPYDDIVRLMGAVELRSKYPNPGDRFVAICKMKDYLKKKLTCVRYDSYRGNHGYVVFNRVSNRFQKNNYELISYLKIGENAFAGIIPCIEIVNPHFLDKYYDTDNCISDYSARDLVSEIRRTKSMIAINPKGEQAVMYFNKTGLQVDEYMREGYLKTIFAIMDFICIWLELQLDVGDTDFMINITSP